MHTFFSNPFYEIGVTFCSCYEPVEKNGLQTPQLDPAESQQLPSGPLHGCQHALSSPISVEGDIAHAVLIKRWCATEASVKLAAEESQKKRKWDFIKAWYC